MDGAMLLSYVNTKLRDEGISLDELCGQLGWDRGDVERRLREIGYEYDEVLNKFC